MTERSDSILRHSSLVILHSKGPHQGHSAAAKPDACYRQNYKGDQQQDKHRLKGFVAGGGVLFFH